MIVFDLRCIDGHRFEGWFGSMRDFDAQKLRGQLSCPTCGDLSIERALSAPRLNMGAQEAKPAAPESHADLEHKDAFAMAQILYSRMLDEILTKSEDVGSEFPRQARKIFYKESPARSIRGQASAEEHEAMLEEGIPVARLPVPPSDRMN